MTEIVELSRSLKNKGLSRSEILSSVMSVVYEIAKEDPENAAAIFAEAQVILDSKRSSFNAERTFLSGSI